MAPQVPTARSSLYHPRKTTPFLNHFTTRSKNFNFTKPKRVRVTALVENDYTVLENSSLKERTSLWHRLGLGKRIMVMKGGVKLVLEWGQRWQRWSQKQLK